MENRSEQTPGKGFADIGREILFAARNELYLNLPYLDVALCALAFQPGGEVTLSLATDGETLYYDGSWLSDRYLRSRVLTNRAYLHVILHCMLRHLGKKQGKAPELWDLACDAAVEGIGSVTTGDTPAAGIRDGKLCLTLPRGEPGPQGDPGEGLSDNAKALLLSLLAGTALDRDASLAALRAEWGVAEPDADATEAADADEGVL